MITKVVQWGEAKVRLTWNSDTQLPPRHLITSAHAFCFKDGKLLLVNLNHKGMGLSRWTYGTRRNSYRMCQT